MTLHDVLARRGYQIRQHLEEEGWTRRKLTVVDLDAQQRQALVEGGPARLKETLAAQGRWSFPALDIEEPLPRSRDVTLWESGRARAAIVAPAGDGRLKALAQALAAKIADRHGVRLPLIEDAGSEVDLLDAGHLIVVGGSHENRLALKLALRCHTFFVDASAPGDDGWIVTTHTGLNAHGHNVCQLTASAEHQESVVSLILGAIESESDRLVLRHLHRVGPGSTLRAALPSWQRFTAELPRRLPQLEGRDVAVPADVAALADLLALGLDGGGAEKNYYNVAPIDIAIACASYYQLSGEPRALHLFRELLFRLADYYLKTPEGASYPADLDFRLGPLLLYYARLEHEPVFTDEDRLILANLLLACCRSVYEYALKIWPVKPDATTRHNHETFPARTLLYAAEYFGRYGVTDVPQWRRFVELVLGPVIWRRFKQRENAYGYEPMVFEHGASRLTFEGHPLSDDVLRCLHRVVERQIATTDNFLRPVDYSDTNVSLEPADSVLAQVLAAHGENGLIAWFAGEAFARSPHFESLTAPVHAFPGIRLTRSPAPPPAGDWECIPLDPLFAADYAPGFPHRFAFDKLAFRTGWTEADQYLLLEGIGSKKVSHAHNEVNGIVRYNHLGRHWIVSNGYGRQVGITNVARSFNTRVLGPEDHNMLVLTRSGQIVRELPVCSALLQRGRRGRLLYSTSALLNYGGTHWFRTLIVLAGEYVLVIDRVQVLEPGLEKAHIEWNALGEVTAQTGGYRLEQQGVYLDVTSASGWRAEQSVADRSASWKSVLDSGRYPYAAFPLKKLLFHMPDAAPGQAHCLGTLLSASRSAPRYAVVQPEDGLIAVEGPHRSVQGERIDDGDLTIRVEVSRCEVRFAPAPQLPPELAGR